jgi:HlyD family secretion protein
VDEADIGRVREGQKVLFSVGAWPEEQFEGRVRAVRLAATVTQNVVTYTVVVTARNEAGKLLPGMTATMRILSESRDNALRVPSAALRFRPAGAGGGEALPQGRGVVHVQEEGGRLRAVPVTTGIADTRFTEIVAAEPEDALGPGTPVVVGVVTEGPPPRRGGLRLGF